MNNTTTEPPGRAGHVRIAWDKGTADIWPLGAAIHCLRLVLENGRTVDPLAEAPWHDDATTMSDETLPAHLRHLGGEWPCVPFGRSEADPVTHGFGTDNRWALVEEQPASAEWEIAYPADHPIEKLRRRVSGIAGRSRVELGLTVFPRRDCVLPVGLHPIAKLPELDEDLRVETAFAHGETFPVVFEPGVSQLAPGRRFDSLARLPLERGGTASLAELCHQRTEEALQILDSGGQVRLVYPKQRYALMLEWNPDDFPTCLFWLSAGGRMHKPWNGRFRGLGVEPLAARFEERDGQGAIVGTRRFKAGEAWTTRYAISAEALPNEGR